MILVAGASGLVGSEVCRRLTRRGQAVRGLVRATTARPKVEALRDCGVELAAGDLKDPDSLTAACRGVNAIISTASSTLSRQPGDSIESVDLEGQLNLVDAARVEGIRRFVFVSFWDDRKVPCPLAAAKRTVEQAISDLNYTTIQANYFMETWLSPAFGFDYPRARARIYGDGTRPISWVSYRDVAELCAVSVLNPAAGRSTLRMGGPEALSPLEVVKIFENDTGRAFTVETVPEAKLQAEYDAATDPFEKSFAALRLMYAGGRAMEMRRVLARFPMRLTCVREYALAMAGTESAVATG